MWAVVPLKSPSLAKSRLAGVLTPEQRRAWFFEMAHRALSALRASRGIEGVAVISADAEVARFARERGALVLDEAQAQGTASAFTSALLQLRPQAPRGVLMMAGDLPLVTPAAIETLLDTAALYEVVVVPDRQQRGTNALVCSPPNAIEPCFGENSFARHLAEARRAQRTHCSLQIEALALDIDVPADLDELRRRCAPAWSAQPMPIGSPVVAGLSA